MNHFTDHHGQVHTGPELRQAIRCVCQWYIQNAHAIRNSDDYAHHVTDDQKDARLSATLGRMAAIERGERLPSVAFLQRLDTHLTGECVALLP